MVKRVLEEGEEYLSILISVEKALFECFKAINEGRESFSLAAFKVEDRSSTQPHYRGSFAAVWKNKKKSSQEEIVEKTVSGD